VKDGNNDGGSCDGCEEGNDCKRRADGDHHG